MMLASLFLTGSLAARRGQHHDAAGRALQLVGLGERPVGRRDRHWRRGPGRGRCSDAWVHAVRHGADRGDRDDELLTIQERDEAQTRGKRGGGL
jgi:hypothetical protein